jgi:hypothetical protein
VRRAADNDSQIRRPCPSSVSFETQIQDDARGCAPEWAASTSRFRGGRSLKITRAKAGNVACISAQAVHQDKAIVQAAGRKHLID